MGEINSATGYCASLNNCLACISFSPWIPGRARLLTPLTLGWLALVGGSFIDMSLPEKCVSLCIWFGSSAAALLHGKNMLWVTIGPRRTGKADLSPPYSLDPAVRTLKSTLVQPCDSQLTDPWVTGACLLFEDAAFWAACYAAVLQP